MKTGHGIDCIACTDPPRAREWITAQRAELDKLAEVAAEHRRVGEAIAEGSRALPDESPRALKAQTEAAQDEYGAANAIAQTVMMRRAELDGIEKAHPHLLETS